MPAPVLIQLSVRGRRGLETKRRASYPSSVPIRVVFAEDNYLVREGVRRLLETQPDLELVAVCGDLDSLLAAVEVEQPDVLITDIRMPPTGVDEGIEAAERLSRTHPEVGVVVLSQYVQPAMRSRSSRAGRQGAHIC